MLSFRLSSLLSKIILIRVPPSLVRSPLPIYSHSNVNFPKWELDHVTPQLITPGCSLKPPKIESSASCLCSHLPRPHFLSSPQIQHPAQLPPVCHIMYFCNCSLLGLESLSSPWPELKTVYPEWIWFLPSGLESLTVTVSNMVMCACIPSLAQIKADALIVEEVTGRPLRLKS